MSTIKQFLKENGYTEDELASSDVNFESSKIESAISKVKDIPEVQQFVQFAARHGLTPYSGERECLLFKVIDPQTGKGINNTVIGGFNGVGNAFEISGSRLWPWKINSGLAGRIAWDSYLRRLSGLAAENNVNHAKGENPPKYLWINLDKPYTKSALAAFLNEWLSAVQDQRIFQDDVLNVVDQVAKVSKEHKMAVPLNQILYGPPGTGKTYHTIEAAVQASVPEFYHNLGIDSASGATPEQRQELQTKFKELSDSKRIRFVTFHQSFGYEEFVEGLSASTTDNDQVKYAVKDGVFKEIADDARKNLEDSHRDQHSLDREQRFDLALEAFKLSIFEESDTFSLTDAVSIISIEDEGFRYCGEWKSSQIMKFVDLQSLYLAKVETRQDVKRVESVSGLAKQHATYFLKALKQIETFVSDELPSSKRLEKQNYVLIIDEINRGNISKIFGELITLIEPSKRKGSDEFIELTLPQSKKPFSVPNNLYLIGTMNTADRSLAMMDTALRRRFDFVEMMPKPELLVGTEVKGVDLQRLLEVLNQRIEILYDREHTLGHAFFMPIKALVDAGTQDEAFNALVSVFKNKIIPLLEEYFFEDWSKIRLVLADNQKNDINLQFVQQHKQTKQDLDGLFGRNHNLDQYGQEVVKYTLAADEDDVWNNAKAYIGIYKSTEEAPTESPESQTESNNEPS